jgi:hypothetical protein
MYHQAAAAFFKVIMATIRPFDSGAAAAATVAHSGGAVTLSVRRR